MIELSDFHDPMGGWQLHNSKEIQPVESGISESCDQQEAWNLNLTQRLGVAHPLRISLPRLVAITSRDVSNWSDSEFNSEQKRFLFATPVPIFIGPMNLFSGQGGFTFNEFMIVISILAVLAVPGDERNTLAHQ